MTQLIKNEAKRVSLKQRNWLKEYVKNGGNATKAAMKTYDVKDEASAAVVGSNNLRKINMAELMDEMGLTDFALTGVLGAGLAAKKIHGTGDNYIEVDDHPTRHKFLDTALKLRKRLDDKASDINIGEMKVVMVPVTVADKYGVSHDSGSGGKEQDSLQGS